MPKGRPKLPEGERMNTVTLRLPQWVIDHYRQRGRLTVAMRTVLENDASEEDPT